MIRITSVLILCLFAAGCSKMPPPPPIDLQGIMNIEFRDAYEFSQVRGIFSVDAGQNKFAIYFQGPNGFPLGNVTVEKGRITEESIELEHMADQMFIYWPYIFCSGKIVYEKKIDKIRIQYADWTEIEGLKFPGIVTILAPGQSMDLRIKYGNKSSGKD